jgi:hypothetical protein
MLAGRVCAWVEASVRRNSLVLDGPVPHVNPSAIAESKVHHLIPRSCMVLIVVTDPDCRSRYHLQLRAR